MKTIQCKAYGGTRCTSFTKGSSRKCVHTKIVGLGVVGSNQLLDLDGGNDEDSGDEGIGSGAGEYKRNPPSFAAKVEHLLRVYGAIKYPVKVIAALSEDGDRGILETDAEISSIEDVCPKCSREYAHVRSVRATAFIKGPDLVEGDLKIKGCIDYSVEAVTGDDWEEHGLFVFGNKLVVHPSHMDSTRRVVQGGTAISHAFDSLIHPVADNLAWMSRTKLAKRALANNYLKKQLLDAYLGFEALTDHPYDFFSFTHGYFPLLSCWDGYNKVATNIHLETYLNQREKQVIDMDLDVVWLTISMLSPMVFGMRLQFSHNTRVTFCSEKRKSNIIELPARGPAPQSGDAETADGAHPEALVRQNEKQLGLEDILDGITMEQLKELYRACFGRGGPGMSRYPTKVMMEDLFKRVLTLWREKNHGKDNCSKFFM